jgi:hypothetical protein
MLKNSVRIVAFIGFLLAVGWVYFEPRKLDPWVAACAALVVFLGLFIPDAVRRVRGQSQRVGGGSTGIQAGGDVSINITSKKDRK